jgi:hypothetical protein
MHTRKATKYVGMKLRSCRLSPTPHTRNTRNRPTCLCWTIRSVNPVWTYFPSGLPLSQQKSRNLNSVKCILSGKFLFFLCWYHKEYYFSPIMISIEILLWCKASCVWSFNNVMFSYLSQMVCDVFMYSILEIGTSSIDWANWVSFTWRRRQNPVSETLCFEK